MHVATTLQAGTHNNKYIPFLFNSKSKQTPKQITETHFRSEVYSLVHTMLLYTAVKVNPAHKKWFKIMNNKRLF